MNSFNCIGNGIAKKRNVSQNFLVASTDTATITYKGYETHNLLQTVTPSFNINIKFDILYRGGVSIFSLESSTNINLQNNIQIEGYVENGYLGLGLYYLLPPMQNSYYLTVNTKKIGDGAWHTVNIIITDATLVVKIDTASDFTYTGNKGLYTSPGYILKSFIAGIVPNLGYFIPNNLTNSYRNIYIF